MPGSTSSSQADEEIDAPESSAACTEYETVVQKLLVELKPELEQIETHILDPAEQLLEVIKTIRRIITKREHKKLDYDRHRHGLRKLQDKKERSLKDERQLYRIDNTLETATEEYNRYNDLLKEELPRLFELAARFIQPLFQSFYYMQLNVFYALYQALQGLGKVGYFELSMDDDDVETRFMAKRGNVRDIAEALSIVHYKSGGSSSSSSGPGHARTRKSSHQSDRSMFSGSSRSRGSRSLSSGGFPSSQPQPASLDATVHKVVGWQAQQQQQQGGSRSRTTSVDHNSQPRQQQPPLAAASHHQQRPYDPRAAFSTATLTSAVTACLSREPTTVPTPTTTTTTTTTANAVPKRRPPPPVKKETATALFSFEAQQEGDLSFKAGDVIEITQRAQSADDWWVGRVKASAPLGLKNRDREGMFPGNYVRLN